MTEENDEPSEMSLQVAEIDIPLVGPPFVGCGFCFAGAHVGRRLNLKSGDIVGITGKKSTACIFHTSAKYIEEQSIHIDDQVRFNAGTDLGEIVKVRKAKPEPATRVVVSLKKISMPIQATSIRDSLRDRPVVKGETITLPNMAIVTQRWELPRSERHRRSALVENVTFTVLETTPGDGVMRITPATKVEIFLEESGKMQTGVYSQEDRLLSLAAPLRASTLSADDVKTFLSCFHVVFHVDKEINIKLAPYFDTSAAIQHVDRKTGRVIKTYINVVIDLPLDFGKHRTCLLIMYELVSPRGGPAIVFPTIASIPADFKTKWMPIRAIGMKFEKKKTKILALTTAEFQACCNSLKPSKQDGEIAFDMTAWEELVTSRCGRSSVSTLFLATINLAFAALLKAGWDAEPIK
jgi:hypothetical protein